MRAWLWLSVIMLSGCSTLPDSDGEKRSQYEVDQRYYQLVEAVKVQPTVSALVDLRGAFVISSLYQPYTGPEMTHGGDIFSALNEQRWRDCLTASERVLAHNYISLVAHYGASVCAQQLGEDVRSLRHDDMLNGLIEAIWATGDGTSESTALTTYSTQELQAFIRLQGLEIVSQALIESDAGVFDLMRVANATTGAEFDMYFDIEHQYQNFFTNLCQGKDCKHAVPSN